MTSTKPNKRAELVGTEMTQVFNLNSKRRGAATRDYTIPFRENIFHSVAIFGRGYFAGANFLCEYFVYLIFFMVCDFVSQRFSFVGCMRKSDRNVRPKIGNREKH